MDQSEILEMLKDYISMEILDGEDIGLDESTPLLEWGIINSMEVARILAFIELRFHAQISVDNVLPEHFINLSAISALVKEVKREDKMIGRVITHEPIIELFISKKESDDLNLSF